MSYAYIKSKARKILETPDVTGFANLVTNLYYGKENSSFSKLLYDSFTEHFPTIVVVKLLQVFKFDSVAPKIQSYSITLLDSLLINLDYTRVKLERESYEDIKTLLKSCLDVEGISGHDFQLLSRILARVSFYCYAEFIPWNALVSYITSVDSIKKALWTFNELPMVIDEEFLMPLLENGLHSVIVNGLLNIPESNIDWALALEGGFNLMLQLVGKKKDNLITDLVYAIVKSVWEMVNVRGKEIVVRKGFERITRKVGQEAVRFREAEYEAVSRLALMLKEMNGIGEATEMAAMKIHEVLDKHYKNKPKPLDLSTHNRLVIHGS